MWAWIVFAVAAVAVVPVVAVALLRGRQVRLVKRVVVVLDTERTIEGVLVARHRDRIELRDVSVRMNGALMPADGSMFIDRARIEWVQVVG